MLNLQGVDILGKSPTDYAHLRALKKCDETAFARVLKHGGLRDRSPHAFNAFVFDRRQNKMVFNDAVFKDQNTGQGITWLSYNTQAMQARIEHILYTEFRLPDFFPIKTDIPEGASAYFYRVVNSFGQGSFIENDGTNATNASITADAVPYRIDRGGIIPTWAEEDVRQAEFGGIPLQTETLDAGTRGCKNHIEQVGLGNAADARSTGLLNSTDIPLQTEPTAWNNLPDNLAVIARIQALVAQIIINTNEIFGRTIKDQLALYVSYELQQILLEPAVLGLSAGMYESVWGYVSKHNAWTILTGQDLKMIPIPELATASATSAQRALLGYPTAEDVWEMGMSISPRILRIYPFRYSFEAPMEYKVSGLNIKRPGGLLYIDNVFLA